MEEETPRLGGTQHREIQIVEEVVEGVRVIEIIDLCSLVTKFVLAYSYALALLPKHKLSTLFFLTPFKSNYAKTNHQQVEEEEGIQIQGEIQRRGILILEEVEAGVRIIRLIILHDPR